MNRFLRKLVFRTISENKLIFIFLIIQFSLAVCILTIFVTTRVTVRNGLNELLEKDADSRFIINIVHNGDNAFDNRNFDLILWGDTDIVANEYEAPLNIADINTLKNRFPELGLSIEVEVNLVVLNERGVRFVAIYDSELEFVYMTQEMHDLLKCDTRENLLNRRDLAFELDTNSYDLITIKNDRYRINNIRPFDEDIAYEYIRLPFGIYDGFFHPRDVSNTSLRVMFNNDGIDENFVRLSALLFELNNKTDEFSYYLSSDFAEFLTQVNRANEEAEAFIFISFKLLVIVTIGMSTTFTLIISPAKKSQ